MQVKPNALLYNNPQEFIAQITAGKANSKIAALDIGQKKIGIALSNLELMLAIPHSIYARNNLKKDLEFFEKFIIENNIVGIIIGLPLSIDGSSSEQAKKINEFATKLSVRLQIAIFFEDESYTTIIANDMLAAIGLKRKKRNGIDDKISAMLILDAFIKKFS